MPPGRLDPFAQPDECTLPCVIALCALMVLMVILISSSLMLAWHWAMREPSARVADPDPDSPPAQRRSRWQQNYRHFRSNERLIPSHEEFDFGSLISPTESHMNSPSARRSPMSQPNDHRYFSGSERLVLSPVQLTPGGIMSSEPVWDHGEAVLRGEET
ncbi:hypothetical protein BR93DRAFT_968951 [Coniochaeta sp. PMI_546]|nr:hypothetical protein BR93DRAFT_968951 [Coniochaeta sp. PMI_546]